MDEAQPSRVLVVGIADAPALRQHLNEWNLSFTDRWKPLLARRFTITGPDAKVSLALERFDAQLDADWWDRQW
jgi:hypothetical protein